MEHLQMELVIHNWQGKKPKNQRCLWRKSRGKGQNGSMFDKWFEKYQVDNFVDPPKDHLHVPVSLQKYPNSKWSMKYEWHNRSNRKISLVQIEKSPCVMSFEWIYKIYLLVPNQQDQVGALMRLRSHSDPPASKRLQKFNKDDRRKVKYRQPPLSLSLSTLIAHEAHLRETNPTTTAQHVDMWHCAECKRWWDEECTNHPPEKARQCSLHWPLKAL